MESYIKKENALTLLALTSWGSVRILFTSRISPSPGHIYKRKGIIVHICKWCGSGSAIFGWIQVRDWNISFL
jgi:hypothetical protein